MSELLAEAMPRNLHIDGRRLLARIEELRTIGLAPGGGINRLAFTPEDVKGRELTGEFMAEAGLRVHTDPAGNLIGWMDGLDPARPALLMGSHIDTVPNGGALDGAYGVLGAIEVLHTLHEQGVRLRHPAAVVAFANEEGTAGTKSMWGSHAFVGALTPEDLLAIDDRGLTVAQSMAAVGGDVRRIGEAAWLPERIAAYLELHIEQGPVLEHLGAEIGVVQAITGRTSVDVVIRGEADHAGTTPMELRRDALVAAARLVLAVHDLAAGDGPVRVATVGCCAIEPGAWNVVPSGAQLRVDLRDVDGAAIVEGLARLREIADRIATMTGTSIEVSSGHMVEPVACDPRLRELIAGAADRLGRRSHAMPSGAGHDAQLVGRIAPVGMIFVPSRNGKSHVSTEETEPGQLVAGADVLLHTALEYDRTTE